MVVLSATHADLKSLIIDLQFPTAEWDEKWMDEYLDDTVKLLDICLALNVEISKLEYFQLLVHYALHLLDFSDGVWSNDKLFRVKGSLQEFKEKMDSEGKNGANTQRNSRIENFIVILQHMSKSLQFGKVKSSSKGSVFLRAMYGVMATTIFLCSVVASALTGHSGPLIELHIPDQFLWSTTFMSFQRGINDEIERCFANGRDRVLEGMHCLIVLSYPQKAHPSEMISHEYISNTDRHEMFLGLGFLRVFHFLGLGFLRVVHFLGLGMELEKFQGFSSL